MTGFPWNIHKMLTFISFWKDGVRLCHSEVKSDIYQVIFLTVYVTILLFIFIAQNLWNIIGPAIKKRLRDLFDMSNCEEFACKKDPQLLEYQHE